MSLSDSRARPRLVAVDGVDHQPVDPRVVAVLEVLAGQPPHAVARRWSVDAAVLDRWVRGFVEAGTAQVLNRPDPRAATQRDRFLAAFAHELRSPLTVARGWVAMLQDGDLPPSVAARSVGRLDESLARLADRIVDVELLAAASLGRLRLEPETVTVGDLARDLENVGEIGGLGPDVEITADPGLMRRVLRDLWLAGRSIPAPRSLRLETADVPPWLEVRVVRDADPIDPTVLQALFEPFDLNDDGTGVTIGLYLARALVIAHAGTLGADQDESHAVLWMRLPR